MENTDLLQRASSDIISYQLTHNTDLADTFSMASNVFARHRYGTLSTNKQYHQLPSDKYK